jgi:hypothetical protein
MDTRGEMCETNPICLRPEEECAEQTQFGPRARKWAPTACLGPTDGGIRAKRTQFGPGGSEMRRTKPICEREK